MSDVRYCGATAALLRRYCGAAAARGPEAASLAVTKPIQFHFHIPRRKHYKK